MSVLYVSHGHPAFAKGGGELAAWRLFEAFRNKPGFEGCGFLAAASSPDQLPAGSEVVGLSPDEWLIKRSTSAITHDTAVNLSCGGQLYQALEGRLFRIIHLHHYLHVGIDLVIALKRWFPHAKLLLTLHDYWGPCVYEGRLLRASGELCNGGSPESCDQCLGGRRRGELAIRAQRLQRLFGTIDHLLSPSYFLKQQYLNWGVELCKISVIENLPLETNKENFIFPLPQKEPLIIGYFGQVNPWKGLDFLIAAVRLVRERGLEVYLEINGIESPTSKIISGIQYNGPYVQNQLADRMNRVHVVAMASIWFENSPMVIQEAYNFGRPVIAPDFGAMAEKIDHQVTGLLFTPGILESMADAIERISGNNELLGTLSSGAHNRSKRSLNMLRSHQVFYESLLS